MGMDVSGRNPKNEQGEYFRSNVWYWHPLWNYIEDSFPSLAKKVEYAHSNDGDGLNAKDSYTLSQLLKKHIESGKTQKYIDDYNQYMNSLPLEDCRYCDSTGYRDWTENGLQFRKVCNACNGELQVKSFETSYSIDLDHIKNFQIFLENCGGFSIW